jgi:hypothetical protein
MEEMSVMQIVGKHVDEEALMKDLALLKVIPYLEKKAKETNTPIDDMLVAQLKALASK